MVPSKTRGKAYTLDVTQIVKTIERLQLRIAARFPGSGLGNVCAYLVQTAQLTGQRARALARPYYGLRFLVVVFVVTGLGAQIYIAKLIEWSERFLFSTT